MIVLYPVLRRGALVATSIFPHKTFNVASFAIIYIPLSQGLERNYTPKIEIALLSAAELFIGNNKRGLKWVGMGFRGSEDRKPLQRVCTSLHLS
jgi:hypothetical protein